MCSGRHIVQHPIRTVLALEPFYWNGKRQNVSLHSELISFGSAYNDGWKSILLTRWRCNGLSVSDLLDYCALELNFIRQIFSIILLIRCLIFHLWLFLGQFPQYSAERKDSWHMAGSARETDRNRCSDHSLIGNVPNSWAHQEKYHLTNFGGSTVQFSHICHHLLEINESFARIDADRQPIQS